VITTAYSFPATYHVLLNNAQVTPVFADIDSHFCLDPDAVEARITPRTRAILAVHTYGYPCQVERLAKIAADHNLALIYDAAHAFGVTLGGRGLASYGDAAVLSFHATKVFTTLEGGCVAFRSAGSPAMERLRLLRNFGIAGEDDVRLFGLNGKMDEVRAAFGLVSLRSVPDAIAQRRRVVERYLDFFDAVDPAQASICRHVYRDPALGLNYAYLPVLVHPSRTVDRDRVYAALRAAGILARRYFYPTVTTSPLYDGLYDPQRLRRADYASRNVLCLPVHHEMAAADCDRVIDVFHRALLGLA
jgi:dTDP-4-amino-4,6-dideoxygalactose transaminase